MRYVDVSASYDAHLLKLLLLFIVILKYFVASNRHHKAYDHSSRKRGCRRPRRMSASGIMLVCKREKFSGPRVRNMRAFGKFSSDIPRRDIPDNNFTGHVRIHVRYAYIPRDRLTEKRSSKINDFVKFSARFRADEDQRDGYIERSVLFFVYFCLTLRPRNLGRAKPLSL